MTLFSLLSNNQAVPSKVFRAKLRLAHLARGKLETGIAEPCPDRGITRKDPYCLVGPKRGLRIDWEQLPEWRRTK